MEVIAAKQQLTETALSRIWIVYADTIRNFNVNSSTCIVEFEFLRNTIYLEDLK